MALAIGLMSSNVNAVNLSYDINNEKAAEYIGYYVLVHRNIETVEAVNPEYDSENPNPSIPMTIQVNKYTDGQWVKEHVRRYILRQIDRGKTLSKREERNAEDAADATLDSDVTAQ